MNMLSLKQRCSRRGVLVALLAGVGVTFAGLTNAFAAPAVGQAFPALGGIGLEGTIPDLKGKVALIDFWASWCAPCKASFPVMKDVQEKFASRGFVVVAVSVDEKKGDMDAFLKKYEIPFVVLHDAKGRLADAAGLEKMPTSFLIGADGKVAAIHSGFQGEVTRKAYLAEVDAALKAAGK
jgi:thiol-disulfide isomerase/thioredoxin